MGQKQKIFRAVTQITLKVWNPAGVMGFVFFSAKQLVLAEKSLILRQTFRICCLMAGEHKFCCKIWTACRSNFHMIMWKTFSKNTTKHHKSTYLDLQVWLSDVRLSSVNHWIWLNLPFCGILWQFNT